MLMPARLADSYGLTYCPPPTAPPEFASVGEMGVRAVRAVRVGNTPRLVGISTIAVGAAGAAGVGGVFKNNTDPATRHRHISPTSASRPAPTTPIKYRLIGRSGRR